MANEVQTEEPNSQAIQTESVVATDTDTSTTETAEESQQKADADPLAALNADPAQEAEQGAEEEEQPANAELFGAPEGDYEIELPEGMAVDLEALDKIAPVAKEFGLSNKGLSRLAAEAYPVVEQQVMKASVDMIVAQRKAWEDQSRTMVAGGTSTDGQAVAPSPIFTGASMDEVRATATKSFERFTTDESGQPLTVAGINDKGEPADITFSDFLRQTGLGNHPLMLAYAYRAGKAISEDTFDRGGSVPKVALSREEKYYGST